MSKVMKNVIVIVGLTVVVFLTSLFASVCVTERVKANTETETSNTITTNIVDASDERFVGTKRIEQMYVTETYTDTEGVYHILMEDNAGYLWEITDIDLYPYEDVLVLMCDNNTESITDDEIIHCWVGLEQTYLKEDKE